MSKLTNLQKVKRRLIRDGFELFTGPDIIGNNEEITYRKNNTCGSQLITLVASAGAMELPILITGYVSSHKFIQSHDDIKELSIELNRIKAYADELMKRYN